MAAFSNLRSRFRDLLGEYRDGDGLADGDMAQVKNKVKDIFGGFRNVSAKTEKGSAQGG